NDILVNNGDITVVSNWNLGAGHYDTSGKTIDKLYYRVGGSPAGEPGTLTIRAARDLNIDADISDGFFQTQNRLDAAYISALGTWVKNIQNKKFIDTSLTGEYIRNVGGYILAGALYPNAPNAAVGAPPVAPYSAEANLISPTHAAIVSSDLFPLLP